METIALHGRLRQTTPEDASIRTPRAPREPSAIVARHLLQSIGTRLHSRAERVSAAAAGPVAPAVGRALERAAARAGAAVEHAATVRVLDLLPAGRRSLAARLQQLGRAAEAVAAEPANLERRAQFLACCEAVVEEVRRVARALTAQRAEVASAVAERVSYTRALLVELADGNAHPSRAGDASADPADERWTIVREIAAQLSVRLSITAAFGFELRSPGGVPLVRGAHAAELVALGEPSAHRPGEKALSVGVALPDAPPAVLQNALGGALGALCELHGGALLRWTEDLDRLALALRDRLNEIHGAAGTLDLDGYPGSDLLCGRRALDLAVAASGPRAIAADGAADAGEPRRFARDLADLAMQPLESLAGASPAGFLGALRTSVAAEMHRAAEELSPLSRAPVEVAVEAGGARAGMDGF